MSGDKLTPEQRETVERFKRERAALPTVFDRIAYDNDPGADLALRTIAALEGPPVCQGWDGFWGTIKKEIGR